MSAAKLCAMSFHLYQNFKWIETLFCNVLFAVWGDVNALTRCLVKTTTLEVIDGSRCLLCDSLYCFDVGNNVSRFDVPKTGTGICCPRHNACAVTSKVQSRVICSSRSGAYQCAKTIARRVHLIGSSLCHGFYHGSFCFCLTCCTEVNTFAFACNLPSAIFGRYKREELALVRLVECGSSGAISVCYKIECCIFAFAVTNAIFNATFNLQARSICNGSI